MAAPGADLKGEDDGQPAADGAFPGAFPEAPTPAVLARLPGAVTVSKCSVSGASGRYFYRRRSGRYRYQRGEMEFVRDKTTWCVRKGRKVLAKAEKSESELPPSEGWSGGVSVAAGKVSSDVILKLSGCVLKSTSKLGGLGTNYRMVSMTTGQSYVAKKRPNPQQVYNELLVNRLYRLLGAAVPRGWRVDKDGDVWLVQEWIDGRLLQELTGSPEYGEVRKAVWSGAALDMLFANYDGMGGQGDNVIIDAAGTAWRIDNAGVLGIRAQGAPKRCWRVGEDGLCNEHETFRSGTVNKSAVMVFRGLPDEALLEQFMRIQQTPGVFDHFTADDQKVLAFRLESYVRQLRESIGGEAQLGRPAVHAELAAIWEVRRKGAWSQCAGSDSAMLEKHYRSSRSALLRQPLCIGTAVYEFNLASDPMTQKNVSTGHVRTLRRTAAEAGDEEGDDGSEGEEEDVSEEEVDPDVVALQKEFPRSDARTIRSALAAAGSVAFARVRLAAAHPGGCYLGSADRRRLEEVRPRSQTALAAEHIDVR
eukprot:TRINITY_DN372_c0_g1_i1.p1 TRINITY_DN372_c0_g1~~TRINITY_DN372_c0_g1_i1.p1  ORF type:complete len:534 (+),score=119.72 TRINITY_DN372_c0_g1_i1:73-1674(+)